MTVSRKDFPRISNFSFTVSPTVTRSDTVCSLMTVSAIQSKVTNNNNSKGSTAKIPRPAFPSDSSPMSKVAPFTFTMPEDEYKKLRRESDQRFETMLHKLNQQMNEFSQKIIELTTITQQVQARSMVCQQTDSAAKSFNNIRSPPRGDPIVPKITLQILPAFWHTFLSPKHVHAKNPSVTKP